MSHATARGLGLKRYFDGKPCRRGHYSERWTSGAGCLACQKLWSPGVGMGDHPIPRTKAKRTIPNGKREDFSWLKPEQVEEWYSRVEAIKNGARFLYGSKHQYQLHKPLDELAVLFVPPMRILERM